MATTPPAAKFAEDNDEDTPHRMQLDPPITVDEEVDIETRERPGKGYGNRGNNGDQHSNGNGVVNVDDDEEKEDDEDDEEEEEDDGDEETFAVEKVLSHRIGKKTNGQKGYQYLIKWLGYDKEEDNTWEDEENCLGSQKLLDDYWSAKGGKPPLKTPPPKANGKRAVSSTPASDVTPASKRRKSGALEEERRESVGGGKKSVDGQSTWKPPSDLASWDDRIAEVETVERTAEGPLLVFIIWKNGHRSCHDTTVVYDKCPQQMLKFYESHLVFRQEDPEERVRSED